MTHLVLYASLVASISLTGLSGWFSRGYIRRCSARQSELLARRRAVKLALREYESLHRVAEECVAKCPCRAARNLLESAERYKAFACRKGSSASNDSVGVRGYISIAMGELKRAVQQTEIALG